MQLDGNEHVGFITGGTVHGHTEFADRLGGDVRFGTELESAQRLACGLSEHLAVLADEGQVPGVPLTTFAVSPPVVSVTSAPLTPTSPSPLPFA